MSRRLFHPRLPHADVGLLLFAPDATRSVTGKQKHNKQTNKEQNNKTSKIMCSLCRSVLCQVKWHSSSCSLNELLTPVLRADVSTGKLDSRFPVNKPQVLQIKVCWNYSSCYKSTKLNFTRWIQKHRNTSKSSQIKLVLIQTWITSSLVSLLANFSRTKWFTQGICTTFFWIQNVVRTQRSFSKSAFHIEIASHSFKPQCRIECSVRHCQCRSAKYSCIAEVFRPP